MVAVDLNGYYMDSMVNIFVIIWILISPSVEIYNRIQWGLNGGYLYGFMGSQ